MERILVIGSPGAGKSTLARKLSLVLNLPLYHIDNLYYNCDGEHVSREELILRLDPILRSERWIIDGNYSATFRHRLAFATAVILLDIDTEVCIAGINERVGVKRSDFPFVEAEAPRELIASAERYRSYTLPKMLAAIKEQPRVKLLRFTTREEANNYLHKLKKGKTV